MGVQIWSPPREFDDYRLVRPLGRGEMGVVWLAEDTVLARHVAVKFIASLHPNAATMQRFLVEARAAARIQHPNVVAVYRAGEAGGRPYLVSEFVRGRTLDAIEKPLPPKRVLEIAIGLSRGLAAAHRKGVLHCDLKPANVVVTEDGAAKLLDFGFARLVGDARDVVAAERAPGASGTPDYMAPEIWRAEPPTRRSDLYSLGALLYELCTGRPPFAEVADGELAAAVQSRDPRPLLEVAPACNRLFAAEVDRCLRRDPRERPESGDALCAALEQVERRSSAIALPEGNPYRGLRTFEAEHRALFFGRGAEISAVLDRLRAEPFVLVAGDSGVGKSSLCRAGVLPLVGDGALEGERKWSSIAVVPGRRPMRALLAAIATLGAAGQAAAERARREASALASDLQRLLSREEGLVVFVDQLEELLAVSEASEAAVFEETLASLAGGIPGLRVLATVRADFLTRVVALPNVGDDATRALYLLRPLPRERLRDVIAGPLAATGTRFESDALVESLADAAAQGGGGLPVLQFALAELWECRDRETEVITSAALESIGGVAGALARHADGVLAHLLDAQKTAARRILVRLVSPQGTRARRTADELTGGDPVARAALERLTHGRLVVAHEAESGSAYELAHEFLIHGWRTLRRWLHEDAEGQLLRDRLSQAALEWERLGSPGEVLWGDRQLREAEALDPEQLPVREAAFLSASRAGVRAARRRRLVAAVAIPLVLGAVYGTFELRSRQIVAAAVRERLEAGRSALSEARVRSHRLAELRREAFAHFDARDRAGGEATWAEAVAVRVDVDRAYATAAQALESALALDGRERTVRSLLADALFERALVDDDAGRADDRDELMQRLALYDDGRERLARWSRPATVSIDASASASVQRYVESDGAMRLEEVRSVEGPATISLERGSYLITLRRPGSATVRYPLRLAGGEVAHVAPELPFERDVPEGFVFVPSGRSLFGTNADDDLRRAFFDAAPLHEVRTAAFLVGRTEVTFGQWIDFLRSLPQAERASRAPRVAGKSFTGAVELRELDGGVWELTLQAGAATYRAREGERIEYRARKRLRSHDWRRFPVVGISALDAEAYVAWLRASGKLPGARLCTEAEWERAARGADDREYPHGRRLSAGDANYDATYGKDPLQVGLDEVGSHPASDSPFGVSDLAGNAFEWTTSSLAPNQHVARGGSFFYDFNTARSTNRQVVADSYRDATLGLRVCAAPLLH